MFVYIFVILRNIIEYLMKIYGTKYNFYTSGREIMEVGNQISLNFVRMVTSLLHKNGYNNTRIVHTTPKNRKLINIYINC